MNPSRRLFLILAAVAMAGCSSSGTALPAAKPVTGTLKRSDGSPAANVLLMLQPTTTGHMTSFEVDSSGAFSGEAIAGPYAWFVAKSAKSPDAEKALAKIPEEFQTGTLDRKVTVGASPLELTIP